MMTLDSMIAVLQAAKEGKTIQFREIGDAAWFPECKEPYWNFSHYEYRAAPEPREMWVREYISGLGIRAYDNEAEARSAASPARFRIVKFREVMEDDAK